jgi:hypothetical protein
MNPDRLNARERLNGAAVERGVARLNGWGIRFDLYSITNGCGATDIIQSAPEYVLGILYDVPTRLVIAENQQRSRMDEIEGPAGRQRQLSALNGECGFPWQQYRSNYLRRNAPGERAVCC